LVTTLDAYPDKGPGDRDFLSYRVRERLPARREAGDKGARAAVEELESGRHTLLLPAAVSLRLAGGSARLTLLRDRAGPGRWCALGSPRKARASCKSKASGRRSLVNHFPFAHAGPGCRGSQSLLCSSAGQAGSANTQSTTAWYTAFSNSRPTHVASKKPKKNPTKWSSSSSCSLFFVAM